MCQGQIATGINFMQPHRYLSTSGSLYILGIILFGLAGCTSMDDRPNNERNQFVTTFYATVEDVTPIKFASHAQEAAAMGAVEGAMYNFGDDDMFMSALFGAVFSGMAVSLIEGDLNGLEVGLQAVDGDYVIVTTENDDIVVGECVYVRVSENVHLTSVPVDYCKSVY